MSQPRRRDALQQLALTPLVLAAPALLMPVPAQAAATPRRPTPAQTEGPFYPVSLPADTDFDLLRQGDGRYARGQPCWLEGQVLDTAGKPLPGLFDQTIANLREISVAYFNNVPTGYAMLVEAMERDAELRARFFAKMRLMLYGGAGLPQPVYDRLQQLAIAGSRLASVLNRSLGQR